VVRLHFPRNEPQNLTEYTGERPEMTTHDGKSRKAPRKTKSTKEQKMKSFKFFKPALATTLAIGSWRLVLLLATAVSLIGYPKPASAATFNVTVGAHIPLAGFIFVPLSVTIHPGDQVKWTWASSGHSTTSGRPGMPNGIWDSGVRSQGATFTRTFNSVGTFPYYCRVHSEVGTVIVTSATPTPTPPPSTTLRNISTRALAQTGDNVMIGGFIVQGTGPKRVIIRAIGPELTHFGITNPLADPTLELHNESGELIASNDDWQTTIPGGIITTNQVNEIQNSGHTPTVASESAIIANLQPGNYTAIVRGVNNTTGVALVEVYDVSPGASSSLGNISARAFVQTGENVMIGGFVVQGSGLKRVIIRAIGPELTQYGITDALVNPRLELYNGTEALIASNDNWQTTILGGVITTNQVNAIQNSGYAPTRAAESAIIANLQPGNYTAIVRGVRNTTGVALVEVYDLD
jgi:plastocyanin